MAAARATLYQVIGRAFWSPLFMSESDPAALRDLLPALPAPLRGQSFAVAAAWENGLTCPQDLALAYARLFLGPFEVLAPPYASFYVEPDRQPMGPVSRYVAGQYAQAGLAPGHGPQELPDHVALEWEFMYFLTYQHAVTGDPRWVEWRKAFWGNHMSRWMPSLAKAVAASTEAPFYQALAAWIQAVTREEPA